MNEKVVFTICSNNYLGKAKVLGRSLRVYAPDSHFVIILCDIKIDEIDYSDFADEVLTIAEIESDFLSLVYKYDIVELNTSIKPRICEYFFDIRKASKLIYFDPDIQIFSELTVIYNKLDEFNIILTPHICTPISLDGQTPGENMFNNFGIYNLGFIALVNRPEVSEFITWWKTHTYQNCYIDVWNGVFVDQLPINHVPIFFPKVYVTLDLGLNMAPWNLHERYLNVENRKYFVNEEFRLVFYHFSGFKVDNLELPQIYYNRFTLANRQDLIQLYESYNEALKAEGHLYYTKIKSHFSLLKTEHMIQSGKNRWIKKIKDFF